ncbi:MAG: hypothetical protein ACRBBS_15835 [Thalassovita sp.]
MLSQFWTIGLLVCSGALNAAGVAALRFEHGSGNVLVGVVGALCWAATSLVFLALLRADQGVAVVAALTSAAGILVVALIGVAFGEVLSLRQGLALALMIAAILIFLLPA